MSTNRDPRSRSKTSLEPPSLGAWSPLGWAAVVPEILSETTAKAQREEVRASHREKKRRSFIVLLRGKIAESLEHASVLRRLFSERSLSGPWADHKSKLSSRGIR